MQGATVKKGNRKRIRRAAFHYTPRGRRDGKRKLEQEDFIRPEVKVVVVVVVMIMVVMW
jgi:hypothetical protein